MTDAFNPYLTQEDVIELVRRQVRIFGGVRKCARNFNVQPSDISRVLTKNKPPSPNLLEGLGLQKVTYYVHKPHTPEWAKGKP